MQTLCSWIYKKICFNSTAYYKAKIQLNSHSANLNFSSWGTCLARCPWDTFDWRYYGVFWESLEGLRWIVFNHARSLAVLCVLYVERLNKTGSKYRNFSTTDLRHGRIRRGCRLFLTIQTFMFERLPFEFVHSHQSILIHLEFNLFVFFALTYSDGHSSVGKYRNVRWCYCFFAK